jgi:hypothetical protein
MLVIVLPGGRLVRGKKMANFIDKHEVEHQGVKASRSNDPEVTECEDFISRRLQ